MEIFSLDLGNIQTKIKSSKTEKVLPSRFRYYDDLGDQSTSLFDSKLDINEYEVNFDNMFSYAWGTDLDKIKANNDPIDTLTFEDRYTTNEFRLLASLDRKSTRLNSSHVAISYAVFCLKTKM